MSRDEIVVLVTAGSEAEAEVLAETLVEEGLAACVNIVAPVRSVYRWKGDICRDQELLLLVKSRRDRFEKIEARVRALHSYDVPEVIAVPICDGSEPYLQWIAGQLSD